MCGKSSGSLRRIYGLVNPVKHESSPQLMGLTWTANDC
jgi:hypothetical protein